MKTTRVLSLALVVCLALAGSGRLAAGVGGFADIKVDPARDHEVRYTSGNTIYVEGLVDGRWVGRYWTADGRINVPYELYADDAFGIEVSDAWLTHGWQWVGAHEEARARGGARHFVVELKNTLPAVDLKIHTLVDGTPVLTRWLEIANTSRSRNRYPASTRGRAGCGARKTIVPQWRTRRTRSSALATLPKQATAGRDGYGGCRSKTRPRASATMWGLARMILSSSCAIRPRANGSLATWHGRRTGIWNSRPIRRVPGAGECQACAGTRASGSK